MRPSETSARPAKYNCGEAGEYIWGTKEQIQAFGIAIGLAFPGEPNGPKRQLSVRDPRGFEVKITKTRWGDMPFEADIAYPNMPKRPAARECSPFPGVRKREEHWYDEFTGTPDCLIAAGLLRAAHLPGAPGMRRTRVTVLADGSVLAGNYSNSIPGANTAGLRHIERTSPRAGTITVRVHIGSEEGDRREARREIADSTWRHDVRKLPRPHKLSPSYGESIVRYAGAAAAAKNDKAFQAVLGRLLQRPTGEGS